MKLSGICIAILMLALVSFPAVTSQEQVDSQTLGNERTQGTVSASDLRFRMLGEGFDNAFFNLKKSFTFDDSSRVSLLRERNDALMQRQMEWLRAKSEVMVQSRAGTISADERANLFNILRDEHKDLIRNFLDLNSEARSLQVRASARADARVESLARAEADRIDNSNLVLGLSELDDDVFLTAVSNATATSVVTEEEARRIVERDLGLSEASVSADARANAFVVTGTQRQASGNLTITRPVAVFIDRNTGVITRISLNASSRAFASAGGNVSCQPSQAVALAHAEASATALAIAESTINSITTTTSRSVAVASARVTGIALTEARAKAEATAIAAGPGSEATASARASASAIARAESAVQAIASASATTDVSASVSSAQSAIAEAKASASAVSSVLGVSVGVANATASANATANVSVGNFTGNQTVGNITQNLTNVTTNITENMTTNITENMTNITTNISENLTTNMTENMTTNITENETGETPEINETEEMTNETGINETLEETPGENETETTNETIPQEVNETETTEGTTPENSTGMA